MSVRVSGYRPPGLKYLAINDNLFPYLALGFLPQPTLGTHRLCALYALVAGLKAVRNLVEVIPHDLTNGTCSITLRHVTFKDLRTILESLEYRKRVFRQLGTQRQVIPGSRPREYELAFNFDNRSKDEDFTLRLQSSQFFGVDLTPQAIAIILDIVNEKLGTFYKLGHISPGYGVQAPGSHQIKDYPTSLVVSGDGVQAWPIVWLYHTGHDHWESLGPNASQSNPGNQSVVNSWNTTAEVDARLARGIYLVMEDIRDTTGTITAYRGQFVYAIQGHVNKQGYIRAVSASVRSPSSAPQVGGEVYEEDLTPVCQEYQLPLGSLQRIQRGSKPVPMPVTIPCQIGAASFGRVHQVEKYRGEYTKRRDDHIASEVGVPLVMFQTKEAGSLQPGTNFRKGDLLRQLDVSSPKYRTQFKGNGAGVPSQSALGTALDRPWGIDFPVLSLGEEDVWPVTAASGTPYRLALALQGIRYQQTTDQRNDLNRAIEENDRKSDPLPMYQVLNEAALPDGTIVGDFLRLQEVVGSRLLRLVNIHGNHVVLPATCLEAMTDCWSLRKPVYNYIINWDAAPPPHDLQPVVYAPPQFPTNPTPLPISPVTQAPDQAPQGSIPSVEQADPNAPEVVPVIPMPLPISPVTQAPGQAPQGSIPLVKQAKPKAPEIVPVKPTSKANSAKSISPVSVIGKTSPVDPVSDPTPAQPAVTSPRQLKKLQAGAKAAIAAQEKADRVAIAANISAKKRFDYIDCWLLEDEPKYFKRIVQSLGIHAEHFYDRGPIFEYKFSRRIETWKVLKPELAKPLPTVGNGGSEFLVWEGDWRVQVELLRTKCTRAEMIRICGFVMSEHYVGRDTDDMLIRRLMAHRAYWAFTHGRMSQADRDKQWWAHAYGLQHTDPHEQAEAAALLHSNVLDHDKAPDKALDHGAQHHHHGHHHHHHHHLGGHARPRKPRRTPSGFLPMPAQPAHTAQPGSYPNKTNPIASQKQNKKRPIAPDHGAVQPPAKKSVQITSLSDSDDVFN